MNSGYTMLSIGALVLFMVAVINANRLIVDSDTQALKGEKYIEAAAMARSLFGEMRVKQFDHLTASDTCKVTDPSRFSLPPLGTEGSSEVIPPPADTEPFKSALKYNDIDDYNNYGRTVNTANASGYNVSVAVSYVKESDYTSSPVRTFLKKITVTVKLPQNPLEAKQDSVTFSTIQAY